MPVYQYRDRRTGVLVELIRSVEQRDEVPAGLERLTVPQRVGIHGTSSSPVDEKSAVGTVPRALKELSNNTVNEMVKESGFSEDKFKLVWGL